MRTAGFHRIDLHSIRNWVTLGLVAALAVFACGDLVAGICADDCENHCDDDCRDCGDCLHCLPGLYMLPAFTPESRLIHFSISFTPSTSDIDIASPDPARIDRPPRPLV
ncbi:MAG: hypothetical protein RBT76_00530 [candidate division Zixibacteria bacterium]|jgi:hypothetical protein|nr:hypothetical protein [candidate division Zixibacteria bacterium]